MLASHQWAVRPLLSVLCAALIACGVPDRPQADVTFRGTATGTRVTLLDRPGKNYCVSMTVQTRPDGSTDINLDVIFLKEPTEKRVFESLIDEVKVSLSAQTPRVPITASAFVGTVGDPTGRHEVRGSNGKFMSVSYDPAQGETITTSLGQSITIDR
ncbi:MAG: hypothetical protein ABIS06_14795 [Vicinamibacterales bacterium]